MKRWRILAVLFCVGPLCAAKDEQTITAQVLDSGSERIPKLTVAPNYPRKARRDRIEGQVQVCFDIDREGRPYRISVRNSTYRAFEKPSIEAVRASSFRRVDDAAAVPAIKYCRTFIFSLKPQDKEELGRGGTQ